MTIFTNTFGLAMRNFTTWPEMPDPRALIDYAVRAEALGLRLGLGVGPHLSRRRSAVSGHRLADPAWRRWRRARRRIKLGTGVLVLPLRNPVVLAKELASLDLIADGRLLLGMASGWYKREFDAVGVPFNERGRIMDRNLEILRRLWTEEQVDGEYPPHLLRGSNMSPKPAARADDADRRLCRPGLQARGAQRRLADLFLHPRGLCQILGQGPRFCRSGGQGPGALLNANQLPIYVGPSRAAVEAPMLEWLGQEWDYAAWSQLDQGGGDLSARVDECVAQLRAQLAVGVQKLIFIPYRYRARPGRDHRPRDHSAAAGGCRLIEAAR